MIGRASQWNGELCLRLKKREISLLRFALFANSLSIGDESGREIGIKSNIVPSAAAFKTEIFKPNPIKN